MFGPTTFSKRNTDSDDTLSSVSLRNDFLDWLSKQRIDQYYSNVLVKNMDGISKYALQRRICRTDLWSITKSSVFQPVYNKILSNKLLRVTQRKKYKIFRSAGRLYLKFLKDKAKNKKRESTSVSPNGFTVKEKSTTSSPKKSRHLDEGHSLPKSIAYDYSSELDHHTDVNEVAYSFETTSQLTIPEMLKEILSTHFTNGFRVDSPIELLRFRCFAKEDFGDEIPMSDEQLRMSMLSCGTLFDGKIYLVEKETVSRIQNKVNQAVLSGTKIIFYSSFYQKYKRWLYEENVVSDKMLKDMLEKLYPKYQHRATYFLPANGYYTGTKMSVIQSEILRIWGEDFILSPDQLSQRLPYIPFSEIKTALSKSADFIWNTTGGYTHTGKIEITDKESTAIKNFVADACTQDGYASISDVPLEEIGERYDKLTPISIQNAVFEIVLSDQYVKNNKILMRKGDVLDALTILKGYCKKLDRCTLQDLIEFGSDLTGSSSRGLAMTAGSSVMVRIDKDQYVAEKYVHFDAKRVDDILDLFVTGEYLPLKGVITFAAFPFCGQAWNLFLLESYCRRFSERFRFMELNLNLKNAGVIVRKSCGLSYSQIMADAVAVSGIALEPESIKDFLYKKGYIGSRSFSSVDELLEQAKGIREKRG